MKAAVIGAGRMGKRHMQNVIELGLELAGICDQRQDALESASGEFRLQPQQCFVNPVELIERIHPECIIIATTAPAHAALTRLAAEQGVKYILCEKPMANSLSQCKDMIDVCKK